jgi:integrase
VRRERWIIRRRYPAARFCLVGIYSARREETIRRTQWLPTTTHPWMNLDAMVYQGKGALEWSTKKRRPPAKIASRLRPHLVRWRKIDHARSDDVVRHSLRHTAATWLMQAGVDMWEAAGWLGMTVEQLEANYGHHHPDFQEEAAEAFGGRR